MPCAKGMAACRRSCLHRQLVTEYRAAREAAELALEAETGMYPAELAAARRPITFREWLEATANPNREDYAA